MSTAIPPRIRWAFDLLATVLIIAASLLLIWTNWPRRSQDRRQPQLPDAPQSLAGTAMLGSHTATAAVIVYSDYLCPFCAAFERNVRPEIESKYVGTGRVAIAYKHFPLETLHPQAMTAAVAAYCAAKQDQMWPLHAWLFEHQRDLTEELIARAVADIRLDNKAFAECAGGAAGREQVKRDAAGALALGITGTPAFLLGRILPTGDVQVSRMLMGSHPIQDFVDVLDALVAQGATR